MPGYLVISPDENPTWALSPDVFAAEIMKRWPDVELTWVEAPEALSAIDFAISLDAYDFTGRFWRDGQTLSLDDAEMEELAQVALWFRDMVPAEQRLMFLDEADNGDVMLERGMTVDQLASAYWADLWGDREPGYVVIAPDGGGWRLTPEVFVARMRERWPDAAITVKEHNETDPSYSVAKFAVVVGGEELTRSFGGLGQTLHMDAAELERLAQMALWFREQAPAEQSLAFIGQGPGARIALERGMTVEQLATAYRAAAA